MGKKGKKKDKKKNKHKEEQRTPGVASAEKSETRLDLRAVEIPPQPKPMKPSDIRALRESLNASQALFAQPAECQLQCGGKLGAGHSRAAPGHAKAAAHRAQESRRAAQLTGSERQVPEGRLFPWGRFTLEVCMARRPVVRETRCRLSQCGS